jgi:hypothetical protein
MQTHGLSADGAPSFLMSGSLLPRNLPYVPPPPHTEYGQLPNVNTDFEAAIVVLTLGAPAKASAEDKQITPIFEAKIFWRDPEVRLTPHENLGGPSLPARE